jgi:NADPH:quinone reductase-like Zn-dependent oxidoreductase
MTSWTLSVARDDLTRTALAEADTPEPQEGEAVLRVDRVGMTANNVTYAVLGGPPFRYWDFFPAPEGWGNVPLWGFADVAASRAEGVSEGDRVYGYLPPAGHLLVRPGHVNAGGFRDASEHRASLPGTYNVYSLTTGDAAYEQEREDLAVLYRPLFYTSFVLADWVTDNALFGAEQVVLSSASSKTAYGAAFLLREAGVRTVGLTSPGNAAFTESLGVYDEVLPYDAVPRLAARPTAYLDVAGSAEARAALRDRLGGALVRDTAVGITQQDPGAFAGVTPFFAPDQIAKRAADWGREGLYERFAAAWRSFAPNAEGWVDVVLHEGPEALRDVWLDVLAGRTAPREGHVVTF